MTGGLVVRADASTSIGTGHVLRCAALAQEWQFRTGSTATFVSAGMPDGLARRLQAYDLSTCVVGAVPGTSADATETAELAADARAAWVVVDGYHFDADFHASIRSAGLRVLLLDDEGLLTHYSADIVVNQTMLAERGLYPSTAPGTELLLGSRFALLRKEYCEFLPADPRSSGSRIVITMGGADDGNAAGIALQALEDIDLGTCSIRILVGPLDDGQRLLPQVQRSRHDVEVVRGTDDMPRLLAWADVALSAAGSTCWELAYLGVPAIVLPLAPNQQPVAAILDRRGIAVAMTLAAVPTTLASTLQALLADGARRLAMSQRGRSEIDGRGAARVVDAMLAHDVPQGEPGDH